MAFEDVLLLAAIVLLPWGFGGVEIWAHRSAATLIVAAGSVVLWKRGWRAPDGSGWLLPAFLLVGWGACQLLPLPPALLRFVSPQAHRLNAEAFPGYGGSPVGDPLRALEAQSLERVPDAAAWPLPGNGAPDVALVAPECMGRRWRSISVEPSATLELLMWYSALLIGFLVLRARVTDRARFAAYRATLFTAFAALAVFALVQLEFWNGKIYWVHHLLVQANPFGPYFNPTNLAGVMELAVPWLAGFVWTELRLRGRPALYGAGFGMAGASLVFCLVAAVAAASKLAIVLIAAGLFLLAVLGARTRRTRMAAAAVALVGLAAAALLSGGTRLGERVEMFLGRSGEVQMLEGRLVVWQSSAALFRDFPVTGAGFGTFGELFQSYVPAGAVGRWNHAHNDYLELVLDGGLIAGALTLWLAWGYVRRVARSLRQEARPAPSRIGLALGVASLAVHAIFDFNHQIPANALLWVACCGMLVPGDEPDRTARAGS